MLWAGAGFWHLGAWLALDGEGLLFECVCVWGNLGLNHPFWGFEGLRIWHPKLCKSHFPGLVSRKDRMTDNGELGPELLPGFIQSACIWGAPRGAIIWLERRRFLPWTCQVGLRGHRPDRTPSPSSPPPQDRPGPHLGRTGAPTGQAPAQ